MASSTKPILLVVHGGWHVPESYAKLTTTLKKAGFDVRIPALPSMGTSETAGKGNLYIDTALVRGYALGLVEDGHQVAVLMHSYGGMVGTNALYGLSTKKRAEQGKPGGISHLIYMCANALPEGQSMVDLVIQQGHEDKMDFAFEFKTKENKKDVPFNPVTPKFPIDGLCGFGFQPDRTYIKEKVADEELEAYTKSFVVWNGYSMYQPLNETPAWKDDVKIGYIYTLGDCTIPHAYQTDMVKALEKEGKSVQTVDLPSGHAPNLTEPDGVTDFVVKITSE